MTSNWPNVFWRNCIFRLIRRSVTGYTVASATCIKSVITNGNSILYLYFLRTCVHYVQNKAPIPHGVCSIYFHLSSIDWLARAVPTTVDMFDSTSLLVYTLLYIFVSACFVLRTTEFVSNGLTVENLFESFVDKEYDHFVMHHIKRSTISVVVHSCLPLGQSSAPYRDRSHRVPPLVIAVWIFVCLHRLSAGHAICERQRRSVCERKLLRVVRFGLVARHRRLLGVIQMEIQQLGQSSVVGYFEPLQQCRLDSRSPWNFYRIPAVCAVRSVIYCPSAKRDHLLYRF